ncbi:MAG: ABC transporter permease [Verrucomicrobiota bacterium]
MSLHPIIELELRQAARRARTYWARFGVSLLAIVVGFGVLTPSFRGVIVPSDTGRALFFLLTAVAFVLCLLSGAFLTADCLSREKREETLGLLFLTDLRGYDIVAGKFVARSMDAVYGLLGIFPIMALALLLGGVTGGEFGRTAVALLNTLFFSLALGIMVSAFSREGIRATGVTLLVNLLLAAGPWTTVQLGAALNPATVAPWMWLSPGFTLYAAKDAFSANGAEAFWYSVWTQQAVAWGAIVAASWRLPFAWQERAGAPKDDGWRQRWRNWNQGTAAVNREERRRWLDSEPLQWLSRRRRYSYGALMIYGGLAAGVWMLGWVALQTYWRSAEAVLFTSFTLHVLVKVWVATEICRRVDEDKRNGALELLLMTPCPAGSIIRSQLAAVRRQFLAPVTLVLVIDVALMCLGLNAPHSAMGMNDLAPALFGGMALFLADVYALAWVGLWRTTAAPRAHRGFTQTFLLVMVMPWLVMLALGSLVMLATDGRAFDAGGLVALWFGAGYFTDLFLCAVAINELSEGFRRLVSEGGGAWRPAGWRCGRFPHRRAGVNPLECRVARR